MHGRWGTLIARIAIAALIAWCLMSVPLPSVAPNTWFAYIQVPVVVFMLICHIGKLLIDTFFYNHYKP